MASLDEERSITTHLLDSATVYAVGLIVIAPIDIGFAVTLESGLGPLRRDLLVIVPYSPRAPHQVTVRKDLRFYGRHDKDKPHSH